MQQEPFHNSRQNPAATGNGTMLPRHKMNLILPGYEVPCCHAFMQANLFCHSKHNIIQPCRIKCRTIQPYYAEPSCHSKPNSCSHAMHIEPSSLAMQNQAASANQTSCSHALHIELCCHAKQNQAVTANQSSGNHALYIEPCYHAIHTEPCCDSKKTVCIHAL